MTTLARKLFTSIHTDSVIRAQQFPNFTFHRILPNAIPTGTVNLRMESVAVSVTLIGLVDIYFLLEKSIKYLPSQHLMFMSFIIKPLVIQITI
jgi:hypothetical protein